MPCSTARHELALAARLAVDRPLAVEHLGEDAGRGRLARAARPGEEVGLALAARRRRRRAAPARRGPGPSARRTGGGGSGGTATGLPRADSTDGVSRRTAGDRRADGGDPGHGALPTTLFRGAHPNRCSRPPAAAPRRRAGGGAGRAPPRRRAGRRAVRQPRRARRRRTAPSSTRRRRRSSSSSTSPVGDSTGHDDVPRRPVRSAQRRPTVKSADGQTLTVPILVPMPAGTCNVSWTTLQPNGEDGARGPFSFEVLARRHRRPTTAPRPPQRRRRTAPRRRDERRRPRSAAATGGTSTVHDAVGGVRRRDVARAGPVDARARHPVRLLRADRRGLAGGPRVHPRRPVPALGLDPRRSPARCSS